MKPEIKKLLILNAPYLLFVYLFDKVGQAVRLAPGADMSAKLLSIGDGFFRRFFKCLSECSPRRPVDRACGRGNRPACRLHQGQEREEIPQRH